MSIWKNTKIFNFGESDDLEETNTGQNNSYVNSNQNNNNQDEDSDSKTGENNSSNLTQSSNALRENGL